MKICRTTGALLTLLAAAPWAPAAAVKAAEAWVAPHASASGDGSFAHPLPSLSAALKESAGVTTSLHIIMKGGTYFLTNTITIPVSAPLSIEAAPGEHPVLSGGVEIHGWEKLASTPPGLPPPAQDRVWIAALPQLDGHSLDFRELWVNGFKAVRARSPSEGDLARLVAWNKTNLTATIPISVLKAVESPASLEMVVDQVWEIADLRIQSIHRKGDYAVLTFQNPEGPIEFGHPWPPITVNAHYQAPFFLVNAIEFLNAPGEWFADQAAGKIYYWPRPGEDLARAQVIAPALETLVRIEGSKDKPVTNIKFEGITFANTTWLRPSEQGHVPLQAGMYLTDARRLRPRGTPYHPGLDNLAWIGRPPGAVAVQYATQILFENCSFGHLASAGLDLQHGCRGIEIRGCTFQDIGGNGIQAGTFSDPDVETHVPYNPPDERDVCSQINIADNLVADCANEDWGCVGIAAGYVRQTIIQHNEVCDLPYTGISVGWGWTKTTNAMSGNSVIANHIHHVGTRLGDLGGIYTLSAQPGTVVAENAIEDISPSPWVPDPQHWFFLYTDEGSSGITVRDNWCPVAKFLQNANGPGNVWENNGPQVSQTIKDAAGLDPAFRHLLDATNAVLPGQGLLSPKQNATLPE